jgi:hypothetical protein
MLSSMLWRMIPESGDRSSETIMLKSITYSAMMIDPEFIAL